MLNVRKQVMVKCLMFGVMLLVATGCVATPTTQEAPLMKKRTGVAPTAALLPIEQNSDAEVAAFVEQSLAGCLAENNVLKFADREKVAAAVKENGVDLKAIFGPSTADMKKLAEALSVDYVLWGSVGVRKTLKFTGWRKDVDIYIKLHDAGGKKVDTWRSMTDFTWAKGETELKAEQMAQSAANHTCAKMTQREY
jgi:TolB-like protein